MRKISICLIWFLSFIGMHFCCIDVFDSNLWYFYFLVLLFFLLQILMIRFLSSKKLMAIMCLCYLLLAILITTILIQTILYPRVNADWIQNHPEIELSKDPIPWLILLCLFHDVIGLILCCIYLVSCKRM